MAAVSEEHSERILQDITGANKIQSGKWHPNMLADYCWTLVRHTPTKEYRRQKWTKWVYDVTLLILSRILCVDSVHVLNFIYIFFSPGATQPIVGVYFTALYRALASSRTRLHDHTHRHATVGRTPLNK
jgi:hypothetical protein